MVSVLGKGRVVAISDCTQAPAYPCVSAMNFSPKLQEPLVTSLNWAQMEEDWEPGKTPNFRSPSIVSLVLTSYDI
jgi:hypothetical protein